MSLSSRRAWIEICVPSPNLKPSRVALLTESVDWNYKIVRFIFTKFRSLSSRRAWIEIVVSPYAYLLSYCRSPHGERGLKSKYDNHAHRLWLVALLTESVDWNPSPIGLYRRNTSRSPHGERGLKFKSFDENRKDEASLSSRRAWIEIILILLPVRSHACRSPHGERGLKSERWLKGTRKLRRSPHGERGLKYEIIESGAMVQDASLSSRRAWIEIEADCRWIIRENGRSPHGERGLKWKFY